MSELDVLIEGELIGRVRMNKAGRLSFDYEPRWRDSTHGHSLSISMPIASITYSHNRVSSYLWNLLPENPNILQRWGQQFHVSAMSPFKLLKFVGADVPGAAQFFPPAQLATIQSQRRPSIDWISLNELAQRLAQLRSDAAAVRRPGDAGKMSLPGAQAKSAFCWDNKGKRWGVPSGRDPTTHIIKPAVPGFDGLVENEHLCQAIAAQLGLPAARSSVLTLDDTPYIVIERFDRLPEAPGSAFVQRVHQEDMCQALSVMPGRKYQQDGGPGIADIVSLIRRVSSDPNTDVERFLDANAFNWLIGGTDAHAKNYSLLIGAGDEVRLSPLYDLSSQLPYPELIEQRVAMKIGDHYDIPLIGFTEWQSLALECAVNAEILLNRLRDLANRLPKVISAARDQALAGGLNHRVITDLATLLTKHVKDRRATLDAAPSERRRSRKIAS
ncbi:MAG TPA: type II toxin-antitoxin system HipA family toxin [Steroidobacteraceae bacterium]|nr:type II toxin-antitoxin system HipA family toxin [Steroidobacteraceae bacterium]